MIALEKPHAEQLLPPHRTASNGTGIRGDKIAREPAYAELLPWDVGLNR